MDPSLWWDTWHRVVVRVCDGRGKGRGSVREEKEGASVRVRVSVDLRKRV